MYTGKRDTLVTIQSKSVTRNADYGNEVVTWADYEQAWVALATANDFFAQERSDRGVVQLTRRWTAEMLRIEGVTTSMRVVVKDTGDIYQIVGIRDLPKRAGMVLDLEEYSSVGV